MKNGWLVVVASLISGLLAVLISITVGACLDQREIKRDVLRRLAGHRYLLTDGRCPSPNGEPFVALNEAIVVFADHDDVLDALDALRTSDGRDDAELIVALIKRMATAAGIKINRDDVSLRQPLVPTAAGLSMAAVCGPPPSPSVPIESTILPVFSQVICYPKKGGVAPVLSLSAALVRGCGQAYALQTVEPVTYRCGTRRVCQARSSGSERDTRARPHAVAPMNCVPEDSRRRSTCTGSTHAPRARAARADGHQTPSSTVAVRAPSPS